MGKRIFLVMALAPLALCRPATADEVRDYEENGVTYREVRRKVTEPVTEVHCVEQQHTTGFREHVNLQMCDQTRSYVVPVTEYRLESHWRGRYNPFVQPYLEQRVVPRTHWETRLETVKVPVATRQLLPVTTTVRVPVTTQKMVERNVVVSRVAISGQPTNSVKVSTDPFAAPTTTPAPVQQFGGVARYDRGYSWGRSAPSVYSTSPGMIATRPGGTSSADSRWRPVGQMSR
jgi:hypothetical protein